MRCGGPERLGRAAVGRSKIKPAVRRGALGDGVTVWSPDRITCPHADQAGAYGLVLELAAPLELIMRSNPAAALAAGRYVYCGNAYGPGGIGARVARHLRRDKGCHWHVDQLTQVARVTAVIAVPQGCECALMAALRALPGVGVPAPGFGSSDCRCCPAHLASVPEGFGAEALTSALRGSIESAL